MLRQASTDDVLSGKVSRPAQYIVIVMRLYPRFLATDRRDEYVRALAPDEKLFDEFRAMVKKLGDHNATFRLVKYEQKFQLTKQLIAELGRLSELAQRREVVLVCQCGPGERCHRDLLLIAAARLFGAPAEKPRFAYPEFERRLSNLSATELMQ